MLDSDPLFFEMRGSHPLLPHLEAISQEHLERLEYLEAISQELPSCTLVANDGGKLQVQLKSQECLESRKAWLVLTASPITLQSHLDFSASPFCHLFLHQFVSIKFVGHLSHV